MPGNDALGFSVTRHSRGHIIFGRGRPNPSGKLVSGSLTIFVRKRPYHFGRKRPLPGQKTILRRKHCGKTLCGIEDKVHLTKNFFACIWQAEKSFLLHKSKNNKKNVASDFLFRKKGKTGKKALRLPIFLFFSTSFHYSPLAEPKSVGLFTSLSAIGCVGPFVRCFRNRNAYATLFSRLSFFWV